MKKEKMLAVMSYLWFLVLIPLLYRNKSHFLETHSQQGIVLLFLWILVAFIFQIPLIGPTAGFVLLFFCIVLWLTGVGNALSNRDRHLPIVGRKLEKLFF